MKKKKWLFALMVAVTALVVAVGVHAAGEGEDPGSGAADENFNATGYPIVNEKVTVTISARRAPWHAKPFDELMFVQQIEEKTNVHVDWIEIPQASLNERISLMLASGDLPDAFMKGIG